MASKHPITLAYGDGIGPEITAVTVNILKAAGANMEFEKIEMGEKLYLSGHATGIEDKAWESFRKPRSF